MKTRAFLFFLLLAQAGFAQNLVQNGSFEQMDTCPYITPEGCPIRFATGWEAWHLSPDYYNGCALPNECSVPYTGLTGTSSEYAPASTGSAFVGLYAYDGSETNTREYLGTVMNPPLVIGNEYFVSVKARLVSSVWSNCATNKMGVLFTTNNTINFNSLINNKAQVYSEYVISDTSWVSITGSFMADSAYQHIIIGNFFIDDSTSKVNLYPTFPPCNVSYFLIDDVCVSENLSDCSSINTITTAELIIPPITLRYAQGHLYVIIPHMAISLNEYSYTIYDLMGKTIVCGKINNYEMDIDCSGLKQGIYLLRIKDSVFQFIIN